MKRLLSPLVSLLVSFSLSLAFVVPALAQGSPPSSPFMVIASGLNNPRGIAVGPNGALYVAEAGKGGSGPCVKSPEGGQACFGTTGAIVRIMNGQMQRIVTNLPSVAGSDGSNATGPAGVATDSAGNVWVAVQGVDGAKPATFGKAGGDLWHVLRVDASCKCQTLSDLYSYEASHNPDGREINSDPYSIVKVSNGEVVADAAANALLHVASDGTVTTLAVFPTRMVKGPGGANIPMESVPDSVAIGPDGAYYVGELTGFPFPVGGARVYRVPAEGGQPQVVATGFTNIISLTFGSDGSMYVLEMFKGGLGNVNPQNPATVSGALIRVAPDGNKTTIASDGLIAPAGVAIGGDGNFYVTNFGILPGQGQVVRINAPAGTASASTLTSTQPVSGQLTGKTAGAFNNYTINYPGGSAVGTITLDTNTNNPSIANAVGVNVYQGSTKLATMSALGNPPGTNSVTFSSATKGPVTVQVYNYTPGRTVSYRLSLSGITTTAPAISTTPPATTGGAQPSGNTTSGSGGTLTGPTSGTLAGNRGGSYANYTVAYPTAGNTQTLTLNFSPIDAATGIYVTVFQNGNTLIKAQGTQTSTPGQLKVSYSSTTAGPVQIQIGNFNQDRTISYTISD